MKNYILVGMESKTVYLKEKTKEGLHRLMKSTFPSMSEDGKKEATPVYPEPMRIVKYTSV